MMKIRCLRWLGLSLGLLSGELLWAQSVDLIPSPVLPVPTQAQIRWHRMEMNAFLHFSINTFTNKEWGYGDENPELFNPQKFDPEQWVNVLSESGFKGIILTAKHHDGFCLWPTAYSEHCVKKASWKEGGGDVVGSLARASRSKGLQFGIYLSPWDCNHKDYGRTEYIQYYRNQIGELLEHYGPFFEIWIDGANGGRGYYGGARETRWIDRQTYYDWPLTLEMIKEKNPDVLVFSDAGPDIRWVGNERGEAGETNWNLLTPDTLFPGKGGIEKLLESGSESGTHWIPAECDVSIRPGWFYHSSEDSLVKTPEELFQIYLHSVGRGSVLLLNVPPNSDGLISSTDIQSLKGFKHILDSVFKNNLAVEAHFSASNTRLNSGFFSPDNLHDNSLETFWATDDGVTQARVELKFPKPIRPHYVVLQEYIALGQRVKSFTLEAWTGKSWKSVFQSTTIGYKRIAVLPDIVTDKLRLIIHDSRACPVLSEIAVY